MCFVHLPSDLLAIHQELGIPPDYAARRGLPYQSEAAVSQLVTVATIGERQIQLIASAAVAWKKMASTAGRENITLLPISGFRSVARQAAIIRRRLSAGQSLEAILCTNAAPGFSEHHSGRAVDIGTPGVEHLTTLFESTDAFAWLTAKAPKFGFTLSYTLDNAFGIAFEPWHWFWSEPVTITD
jgi:D-alanyl-D-alanine carboxypeptidase